MGAKPSIFISYTHRDKEFVRRLARDLRQLGVDVWHDEVTVQLGDLLKEKIREGIAKADYVAIVLSRKSARSDWVRFELGEALKRRSEGHALSLLPIIIDDCELPEGLRDTIVADFSDPRLYQSALDMIIKRVGLPQPPHGTGYGKQPGMPWPIPEHGFNVARVVNLQYAFYDGQQFRNQNKLGTTAGLTVTDDGVIGELDLAMLALLFDVNFADLRGFALAHYETELWLKPDQTWAQEGVRTGDHLIVVIGAGLKENLVDVVQKYRAFLSEKVSRVPLLMREALSKQTSGQLPQAVELLDEAVLLCREHGDTENLQRCFGNLGAIHIELEDYQRALSFLEKQKALCEQIGSAEGLQACLCNLANIHHRQGDLDRAESLHRDEERICRELGNPDDLGVCLANQAQIAQKRGELIRALCLLGEASKCIDEKTPVRIRDHIQSQLEGIRSQISLVLLQLAAKCAEADESLFASAHRSLQQGDTEQALALLQRQENLGRKAENPRWIAEALTTRGIVLRHAGRLDVALCCHDSAEKIARSANDLFTLVHCLGNESAVCQDQGRMDVALKLLRDCATLWHWYGTRDAELQALGDLFALMSQVDPQKALSVADEALAIATAEGKDEIAAQVAGARDELVHRLASGKSRSGAR